MGSKEQLGAIFSAEDKYRLLVNAVTDYAIYMLDPQGIIASWNTGAERLKGYAEDEVIGQHFSLFYSDKDRDAGLPAHGLSTAAQQGRFATEGWRVRKDGSRFMAHVIIDAIRDEQGELTGFAKVTRDITERVESQRALDRAREELQQVQKMEAVGRLTGGVAHDFNNFLTIILISLKMARKRLLDAPDILRFIDNAIQGAERGASLTQRMLAFSSRQSLHLEALCLADLVHDIRELLQRSIGPATPVLVELTPGLPRVQADAHQLEAALLNLVLNARDAMPGGGEIRIGLRRPRPDEMASESDPAQWLMLEVVDTGMGMDEATLSHAIEPFFTSKGIGKGTGLGLSMVHGITEQLGGKLKLFSTPGQGTRVQMWLPVWPEPAATATAPVPETETVIPPLTVLAVDDDSLVLANTCALLEELGHQTLRATSAAQALTLLKSSTVDLVITDHAMPGMTGSQLAELLRTRYPTLPVLLVSGYAEISGQLNAAFPLLAKPFDERGLLRAMARVLGY